jgi:hypothetical protein
VKPQKTMYELCIEFMKKYMYGYVHWAVFQFNMAENQDFPVTHVEKLLISI